LKGLIITFAPIFFGLLKLEATTRRRVFDGCGHFAGGYGGNGPRFRWQVKSLPHNAIYKINFDFNITRLIASALFNHSALFYATL